MNFIKPQHCMLNRDRLADLGRLPKKERGERQVRCETCRRWCYESDRCNLFTALGKCQHKNRVGESQGMGHVTHEECADCGVDLTPGKRDE